MAIFSSTTSAAEANRLTTISHLDDAASPAAANYVVGFVPRYVASINATDRVTKEWYEGMASGHCITTTAAGARTLDTTGGITVQGTAVGFAVLQNKQYRVQVSG